MRLNQTKKKEYFTEIYNQSFDYVYSYVFARTAGGCQLTEDIVQETFASAWSSFEKFNNKSTYRTWLCSIAKNKLREHYRRMIYKENFELDNTDSMNIKASNVNVEKAVICNETRICVLETLNELSPLYRYVLIMKYIEGMSVKEIAKLTGKTAKAVDGVLQRAKAVFEKVYFKNERL